MKSDAMMDVYNFVHLIYFSIASKIFFFHCSNSIWYSYMCKKDQRFQHVALKHVFMTLKLVQIGGANCFLVDKRIEKHLTKWP